MVQYPTSSPFFLTIITKTQPSLNGVKVLLLLLILFNIIVRRQWGGIIVVPYQNPFDRFPSRRLLLSMGITIPYLLHMLQIGRAPLPPTTTIRGWGEDIDPCFSATKSKSSLQLEACFSLPMKSVPNTCTTWDERSHRMREYNNYFKYYSCSIMALA